MKLGFIGCGNMGGALARAASGEIFLYDKNTDAADALATEIGGNAEGSAVALTEKCDMVFLGVKPNIVPAVLEEIKHALDKATVLVSMAAGVAIEKLETVLGKQTPVIRIMPNTPAQVGEGMILVCKNAAVTEGMLDGFLSCMSGAGRFDVIDERLIDAASAVSGCGPAFVYMFIEALADGGVKCGLPRDKALLYAETTVKGAAALALSSGKNPGALKDAVCSPGGSTIAGVRALEQNGFRGAVIDCIVAANEKNKELGK